MKKALIIIIAAAIVLIWNWQTLLWVVGGGIVALLIFRFIINQLFKDWTE